jgi:hypothetical protein
MSYSIAVYYRDGTKASKPLASAGAYTVLWEEPAQALSLQLILSIVDSLYIVERAQAEKFQNEMSVLRAYHLDHGIDQGDSNIERLDRLIGVFDEALAHWEDIDAILVS